ncbi:hypothetical protein BGZ49_007912 [Haplosporangium sp. Z 27]|nr:hypothetical protein BGZ49_007912 [Haplosporangium sp. Z 27]
MSSTPVVTASYTVVSLATGASSTETTFESLTFKEPIALSSADPSNDTQASKEQYLTALAATLATLQDSINAGLTERLVQQGVLSETSSVDPSINTKLRTKVPGQPNNSKKGQTKKQQQREQKQKIQEQEQDRQSESEANSLEIPSLDSPALETASNAVDTLIELSTSTSTAHEDADMQEDSQYRPKGGIYGDDDENDTREKDEVDLVMEADPGEVDGACLELPKDQQVQQQREVHNKKRNELPTDASGLAAAKKSRGSGDE